MKTIWYARSNRVRLLALVQRVVEYIQKGAWRPTAEPEQQHVEKKRPHFPPPVLWIHTRKMQPWSGSECSGEIHSEGNPKTTKEIPGTVVISLGSTTRSCRWKQAGRKTDDLEVSPACVHSPAIKTEDLLGLEVMCRDKTTPEVWIIPVHNWSLRKFLVTRATAYNALKEYFQMMACCNTFSSKVPF